MKYCNLTITILAISLLIKNPQIKQKDIIRDKIDSTIAKTEAIFFLKSKQDKQHQNKILILKLKKYFEGNPTEMFEDLQKLITKRQNQTEQQFKVSENLCCSMSLEIMNRPMLSPSGISYEEEMIRHHLQSKRYFDPTTRQVIYEQQLTFNKQLSMQINEFKQNNQWHSQCDESNIDSIQL